VGEVERLGKEGTEIAQGIPGERCDPGAEQQGPLAETRTIGAALLGVAARGGVDPQVVDADAVALLVMLTGAILVQQIEGRRRIVVQDEERMPAVLASRGTFTYDDGAYGAGDALDDGGRLVTARPSPP
jgi:hypothetical protein